MSDNKAAQSSFIRVADRFLFGFEESCGYLSASYVRDKDAVNASLLICEMTAYYRSHGKTLCDAIDMLYKKFGCYSSSLLSFSFEGADGINQTAGFMEALRNTAPDQIAGYRVLEVRDYLHGIHGLPSSNVLQFCLEQNIEAVIRPSGTEPKLKVYLTTSGADKEECQQVSGLLADWFRTRIMPG